MYLDLERLYPRQAVLDRVLLREPQPALRSAGRAYGSGPAIRGQSTTRSRGRSRAGLALGWRACAALIAAV